MVRIILATKLDWVALGAESGAPIVGMVPANAELERTHVKASVTSSRFTVVSPMA